VVVTSDTLRSSTCGWKKEYETVVRDVAAIEDQRHNQPVQEKHEDERPPQTPQDLFPMSRTVRVLPRRDARAYPPHATASTDRGAGCLRATRTDPATVRTSDPIRSRSSHVPVGRGSEVHDRRVSGRGLNITRNGTPRRRPNVERELTHLRRRQDQLPSSTAVVAVHSPHRSRQ
jgi:hypothetical protein